MASFLPPLTTSTQGLRNLLHSEQCARNASAINVRNTWPLIKSSIRLLCRLTTLSIRMNTVNEMRHIRQNILTAKGSVLAPIAKNTMRGCWHIGKQNDLLILRRAEKRAVITVEGTLRLPGCDPV